MSWDISREQWDREPNLIKEQEAYKMRTGVSGLWETIDELKVENTRLQKRIELIVICVEGGCKDDQLIYEVKAIANGKREGE
jgi:hypothetical protein